jgi:hypothetical protein
MEHYSGPKMMDDEYLKSNIARSIDWDSTVPSAACGVPPEDKRSTAQNM